MAISGSVLRQLSDGLAELYASAATSGGLDYAARVVEVVSRLVPADSCSYNYIGGAPSLLAWLIEPADVGTFPGGIELFQQHLPEHPVLAHQRAAGENRPRRISDFLSARQFRSLGLYHDFYRLCRVEYQVALGVPAAGGGLIAVALNRQLHDFTADEVELLDLVRGHIGQAAGIALLTPRQARIVQLVAEGQSDRGIARSLGISVRTVQAHLQHIYRALDVTSRTEAVARIRELGGMPGLSLPAHRARW
jgi:DNA-binding CsgD family transcriptional regulator